MKITSLTMVQNSKEWGGGERLLAFFDVEFCGIAFRDAMLIVGIRTGKMIVQPPRGETRTGVRATRITDPALRDAIAAAAYNAFLALGGEPIVASATA